MIKNLMLSLLIFFVIYILLIFKAPEIAGMIENTLGINGFNNFVLSFKGTYDETVTKIPTQNELINAYDSAYSGAIDYKDKFEDGLNITKDKVDSIRVTLSGAEDTINNLKDGYDKTKEFYDTNSGVINDINSTINTATEVRNTLNNTGN